MEKDRVFTDEELKEIGAKTLDLVFEAIEAGDKEKAKKLSKRMYDESIGLSDVYRYWVTGLMSYIYRTYGIDSLDQAYREAFKMNSEKMEEASKKADLRGKVKQTARALRALGQALSIREDDEKICLTMQPCGSGQKLLEQGAYGPPCNFAMIEESHPITFGRGKGDFPVYCAHAAVLEILAMERSGYPNTVAYPAEPMASASCTYCIYKDPKDIPEEVYKRAGKEKPESF
ncbi:hypothetical protein ACFL9T_08920 [Thermodesulfobacteriota bacterium]